MDPATARSLFSDPALAAPGTNVNAPATAQALSAQFQQAGAATLPEFEGSFVQRNAAPGIALDIRSGIPSQQYAETQLLRDKADQVDYLRHIYGEKAVRLADTGDIIVRVPDGETGKLKDMTIKPGPGAGLSAKDFIDLGVHMPEIAGGIIAAMPQGRVAQAVQALPRLASLLSSTRMFPTLVRMAVGTEAAGAATDIAARKIADQPVKLGEIAASRAEGGVVDLLSGAALGLVGKGLLKLRAPFPVSGRGPLQLDALAAREVIEGVHGLPAPLTPGEATGSRLLSRTEAYAEKLPGSSKPLQSIVEARQQTVRDLQDIALGRAAGVPEQAASETGAQAIGTLKQAMAPVSDAAARAQTTAAKVTTGEIAREMGEPLGRLEIVDRPAIGESIRAKAQAMRSTFQGTSRQLYDTVFDNPNATREVLSADSLSDRFSDIVDELPKAQVTRQTKAGPVTQTELLRKYVPEGVLAKLEEITSLPSGSKISLASLKGMRTEIDNAIAAGEAVPGVRTHFLGEMRKALSDEIQSGIDKIGDPTLKAAWHNASTYYKQNVGQFQEATVARLFREPEQGSYLGGTEIVDRAISSPDDWLAYKKFFGATSPEVASLTRAARNRIFAQSYVRGSSTIDAAALGRNMDDLYKNQPEIFKDVFGATADKRIGELRQVLAGAQGKLDVNELMAAAQGNTLSASKLRQMILAQDRQADLYRNDLLKAIDTGKFATDNVKPAEFVDKLVRNTRAQPSDVAQVVGMLQGSPDVLAQVRRQAVQDIFDAATVESPTSSISQRMSGQSGKISPQKLFERLGDADQQRKYQMVLGQQTYDDLINLAKYLRPAEVKESEFATAGGLAAGSLVARLLRLDLAHYGEAFVRNLVLGSLYTSAPARSWITAQGIGPKGAAVFVNSLIASTPFVESLAKEYGADKARDLMWRMKGMSDRLAEQQDGGNGATPERAARFKKMFEQTK